MRRLLVLVSSIVFVDALLFGALSPLVPGYADEFDLSKAQAGLLVASFGGGAFLGGIPGGVAAARLGPRRAVVGGLTLFAVASFAFALSDSPWTLGGSRFVQGFSSTVTWAGAFAWLTVASPRGRRGELIGMAFSAAVVGAILGPMFGAVAHVVGVEVAFSATGIVGLALATWAWTRPDVELERPARGAARRAFRDPRFLGGLWLNILPAALFGILYLLGPLTLDAGGFGPLGIGAVFLVAGALEAVINPLLGRISDRRGRLVPVRAALAASVVVAILLASFSSVAAVAVLIAAGSVAFGCFYTPGMALTSDRAEAAGLAQGVAFGLMNSAWALGNLSGPSLGGVLADAFGDAVPYLAAAGLCLATLAATARLGRGRLRERGREALEDPVGVE